MEVLFGRRGERELSIERDVHIVLPATRDRDRPRERHTAGGRWPGSYRSVTNRERRYWAGCRRRRDRRCPDDDRFIGRRKKRCARHGLARLGHRQWRRGAGGRGFLNGVYNRLLISKLLFQCVDFL